jgi:hypothetical protein
MFSDSSFDSDDVAVIRHSILDASEQIPYIQSLSVFAKLACGWSGKLKQFLFSQQHENSFAAIAVCPPLAVTREVIELRAASPCTTGVSFCHHSCHASFRTLHLLHAT